MRLETPKYETPLLRWMKQIEDWSGKPQQRGKANIAVEKSMVSSMKKIIKVGKPSVCGGKIPVDVEKPPIQVEKTQVEVERTYDTIVSWRSVASLDVRPGAAVVWAMVGIVHSVDLGAVRPGAAVVWTMIGIVYSVDLRAGTTNP